MVLNVVLGIACWLAAIDSIEALLIWLRGWLQKPPGSVHPLDITRMVFWAVISPVLILAGCRLFGWL